MGTDSPREGPWPHNPTQPIQNLLVNIHPAQLAWAQPDYDLPPWTSPVPRPLLRTATLMTALEGSLGSPQQLSGPSMTWVPEPLPFHSVHLGWPKAGYRGTCAPSSSLG